MLSLCEKLSGEKNFEVNHDLIIQNTVKVIGATESGQMSHLGSDELNNLYSVIGLLSF